MYYIFKHLNSSIFDTNLPNFNTNNYSITENNGNYLITVELAGVKKEDIEIFVENDELTIETNVKNKFKKQFTIPNTIDINSISASHVDGLLKVTLQNSKPQNESKRAIEIQ